MSFDIDGLDAKVVPATGTPVAEGLSLQQGLTIVDHFKNNFNFVSAEIVEFNPDLAKTQAELTTTENSVKQIIECLMT